MGTKIGLVFRASAALVVALLTVLPAAAGLHYLARSWQEGDQATPAADQRVEAWVEGDSAKILFSESGNEMTPAGSYIVTTDGGKTVFLVDPDEETFSEWDVEAMMRTVGDVMESMGGMFEVSISDPTVERLLKEDGGTVAGLATTHHRFRTSYSMKMRIMGTERTSDIVTVSDIWSTDEIEDAAMSLWLERDPPRVGDGGLDKLVEAEMSKIEGLPLKTVEVQTSIGEEGEESVTRTYTEVEKVERMELAPSMFIIPEHFVETELVPIEAEDQELLEAISGSSGDEKRNE